MELILWKDFSKRKNSTKIPTTAGTAFDIVLKEDTDIENPVIVLEPVDLGYTYAKFNNNYYFVDSEIVLTKNLMQLTLSMDSLASNKTAIGNTNAFIVYSSTGYDTEKIDNRIGVGIGKTMNYTSIQLPMFNPNTGCYIVSVANNQGGNAGFASQYVMNASKVRNMATDLFSDAIIDVISKMFNNPYESLISVKWVPFDYETLVTGYTEAGLIVFGNEAGTDLASRLTSAVVVGSSELSLDIGKIYDDFRQMPPYTTMSLFVPFMGNIDLNAADFYGSDTLKIKYSYDLSTGDVALQLKNVQGIICQTISINVAVDYPIAQVNRNVSGALSGTAGTAGGLLALAGGIATENAIAAIGGGLTAVFSAASSAMAYNTRSTSVKGDANGRSMAGFGDRLILAVISQDTEDPDDSLYIARQGRPVMRYGTISAHPGYVQCANASFAGSVLSGERDEINSYLNSGFYYE